jgi:hypothetical protein
MKLFARRWNTFTSDERIARCTAARMPVLSIDKRARQDVVGQR